MTNIIDIADIQLALKSRHHPVGNRDLQSVCSHSRYQGRMGASGFCTCEAPPWLIILLIGIHTITHLQEGYVSRHILSLPPSGLGHRRYFCAYRCVLYFTFDILLLTEEWTADAAGEGSCPPTGIKYPTKLGPLTSTTSTTSYATIKNSAGGGIIAAGNWMMQPLPNFSLSGSISSFTLKSQKGICGVSDGIFSCGKSVIPSTFSAVSIRPESVDFALTRY